MKREKWCFLFLFAVYSLINLGMFYYIEKKKSLFSNRLSIIIPIVSMVMFPVAMTYCYINSVSYFVWILTFLWIVIYEIILLFALPYNEISSNSAAGTLFSVMFMIVLPCVFMYYSKKGIKEVEGWIILVGVCIYMAAIKYWGNMMTEDYFLEDDNGLEIIYENLTLFQVSILGALLYLPLFLLSGKGKFIRFLLSILITYFIILLYVSIAIFHNRPDRNKVKAGIIELIGLWGPTGAFWYDCIVQDTELPNRMTVIHPEEFFSLAMAVAFVFFLISVLSMFGENVELDSGEDIRSSISLRLRKLFLIMQSTPNDPSKNNFVLITVSLFAYIIGIFFVWCITENIYGMENNSYLLWWLTICVIVLLVDWWFLAQKLLSYYASKIKVGKMGSNKGNKKASNSSINLGKKVLSITRVLKLPKRIIFYRIEFEKAWEKFLRESFSFREMDAKQFYLGNRLRPILFFMGASYAEKHIHRKTVKQIIRTSFSIELIHKASIMFDDLIDGDDKRNGEDTFNRQYTDPHKLILIGCTMLGVAGENFSKCSHHFSCGKRDAYDCFGKLSRIVSELCSGCYDELRITSYSEQSEEKINKITYSETVFLIKTSLVLGYCCYHEIVEDTVLKEIEKLGEHFGYIFQWLNDLEPFSQKENYINHKGSKMTFDFGKKSIALMQIYNNADLGEKRKFDDDNVVITYDETLKMYEKYGIESLVLSMVNKRVAEMNELLVSMGKKDSKWEKEFRELFDYAVESKGWTGKVVEL